MPKLTPDQIRILKRISNPETRQKYTIYYQLPQKVQDIIFATETAEKIQKIILKRYKLSREQLWLGSYITGMVLLGITALKEFSHTLEEKLEVAPDIAQSISRDINKQIFAEVSEELKEIHKELSKEAESEVKPEEKEPSPPTPIRPPRLPEERRDKPAVPEVPEVKAELERPPIIEPPEVPSEPETPKKLEDTGPRIKGNVVDLKNQ